MSEQVKRYAASINDLFLCHDQPQDNHLVRWPDYAAAIAERDAARQQLADYESTDHELLKMQNAELQAAHAEVDRLRRDLRDAARLIERLCYRLNGMPADAIKDKARKQIVEQATGWLDRKGLGVTENSILRDDQKGSE